MSNMAIFMEAIPLCPLLNKPRPSLRQHRVISIQLVTDTCLLHVSACTVLRPSLGRLFEISRKCLLSLGAESVALQLTIQKFQDIENYNFAFCFVWV